MTGVCGKLATMGISHTQCLAVVSLVLACSRHVEQPASATATATVAPDRLAPTEPLIGAAHVWGLRVPDGMTIGAEYPRTVYLSGSRPLLAVTEALREQLLASQVEVTPTRMVFERAYVKGATQRRLLRVEALTEGVLTRVNLTDITPTPATTGLSEAEQWERAGRNPDGTVKNPSQVL